MNKYIIFLALIFQTSLLGAAEFRINISGINGTASKPVSASEGVVLQQANWLKKNKDRTLSCNVETTKEWKQYSFSFMPKKSGKYTISIMSGRDKVFASCDEITIEGATLKNGNFEELNDKGEPLFWIKMKNPRISSSGGVNDSKFVTTAHNDRWAQIITCTKGQTVTVTFYVRENQ